MLNIYICNIMGILGTVGILGIVGIVGIVQGNVSECSLECSLKCTRFLDKNVNIFYTVVLKCTRCTRCTYGVLI